MILVVSGNYNQFKDFLRNVHNPCEFKYVHGKESIFGFHEESSFIRIGTWYERDDWDKILTELKYNRIGEVQNGNERNLD